VHISRFHKSCILLSVTFTAAFSLNAQETTDDVFITLLKADYIQGAVVIRFETLQDEDAVYRIYRSTSPITGKSDLDENSPAGANLAGEIKRDELPFSDHPEKDGKYYYMVSVVKEGIEYFTFIPYQNTTLIPVDYAPFPEPVQRITVQKLQETTVSIRYSPVRNNYLYRLYLSEKEKSDLSGLSPCREIRGEDAGFKVNLQKGRRYFFYVTTRNRLGVENRVVYEGKNTATISLVIKKTVHPKPPSNRELIDRNLRINFHRGRYRQALDSFRVLTKRRNLTKKEAAIVHFYSAQCLFYLGDYRKALKLFIQGKEEGAGSGISDAWIERCLEKID